MNRHPHLRAVVDFYAHRAGEDERLAASALGELEFVRAATSRRQEDLTRVEQAAAGGFPIR